jgi:heme-degrading monooxygenase HmoA
MHLLVWTYEVRAEHEREFRRVYAPDGDWARFFALGDGYLGTELLADATQPLRYLTIDRWTTLDAYAAFGEANRADYDALDRRCEALTERETFVGAFVGTAAEGVAPAGGPGGVMLA